MATHRKHRWGRRDHKAWVVAAAVVAAVTVIWIVIAVTVTTVL
jgi:hypothetical protein